MNNDLAGTLLLSSAGFLNPKIAEKVVEIMGTPDSKKVAIITTAAEGKETNKYSVLAKNQLGQMGFKTIDFIDLELDGEKSVEGYDMVYVCGGNTFKLIKFIRESNFKAEIINLLHKGGLYFGVSAGSLIVGPSIKIVNEVNPDNNDVGLSNMSGLNIIKEIIFPHYESSIESEILNFESVNNVKVVRLTNDEALLVRKDESIIIS